MPRRDAETPRDTATSANSRESIPGPTEPRRLEGARWPQRRNSRTASSVRRYSDRLAAFCHLRSGCSDEASSTTACPLRCFASAAPNRRTSASPRKRKTILPTDAMSAKSARRRAPRQSKTAKESRTQARSAANKCMKSPLSSDLRAPRTGTAKLFHEEESGLRDRSWLRSLMWFLQFHIVLFGSEAQVMHKQSDHAAHHRDIP